MWHAPGDVEGLLPTDHSLVGVGWGGDVHLNAMHQDSMAQLVVMLCWYCRHNILYQTTLSSVNDAGR